MGRYSRYPGWIEKYPRRVFRDTDRQLLEDMLLYVGTFKSLINKDDTFYTNLFAVHTELLFDLDHYKGDKERLSIIRGLDNQSDIMLINFLIMRKFRKKKGDFFFSCNDYKIKFNFNVKNKSLNNFIF